MANGVGFAGGAFLQFPQGGSDSTPEAFAFTDQTGVGILSTRTSNAIEIAGINTAATISIVGGEYSVNGGAWTSADGTVDNADSVRVRHTASAAYETQTDTVLSVGGVSDTFSSTTESEPAPGAGVIVVRWWRRRSRR